MNAISEGYQDGITTYTPSAPTDGRCLLLDLPGEILSQIASHLPLPELLSFLTLHPLLLSLTRTNLSPLPSAIRSTLNAGQPYPATLEVLPHLNTLLPSDREDQGKLFIPVLVQARPKWLLERFQFARWTEEIWREAFERRYLPSWKRYKGEDDTWRATFLRLLGRLEHRNLGCTHEESWTRFVTLHRNGSASINRIYSRLFDPYEIFDELKHQNNFASHPTQIRVLIHLQDVRVIAVGVLLEQPSLFVNPNAHLALHPPLLRDISTALDDESLIQLAGTSRPIAATVTNGLPSSGQQAQTSAAYGLNMAPVPSSPTLPASSTSPTVGGPSIRSTLANFMPGRRRTSSSAVPLSETATSEGHTLTRVISPSQLSSSLGRLGVLTTVRSRESDDGTRRRAWSFGRSGAGSNASATQRQGPAPASVSEAHGNAHEQSSNGTRLSGESAISGTTAPNSVPAPAGFPNPPAPGTSAQRSATPASSSVVTTRLPYPYPFVHKPQPAPSHTLYPNFTPARSTTVCASSSHPSVDPTGDADLPPTRDLRIDHAEAEDEFEGGLWARDDAHGGGNAVEVWGEGGRMAEWIVDAKGRGSRRRWVGPMLIMAQLHPCTRSTPHPPGADPVTPLEGAQPDLGPKGMYASLGFEDVEALFPWVKLRGSGANSWEAKRGGLGFE